VDALAVVGADDDVAQGGAVLEDEDGVLLASLGLVVAGRRVAVPLHVVAVKGLAGRDRLGRSEVSGGGGRGEGGPELGVGLGRSQSHGGEDDEGLESHFCFLAVFS